MSGVARRLGRGAAYVIWCLLALELGLHLVGRVAPALVARRSARPEARPGSVTILCVGDSHTYGAPLPAAESYPAQLQALLARRYPDRTFDVINLGIAGVNTAYVANRLEREMLRLRPHLVIVWVGVNNVWNAAETDAWDTSDRWLAFRRLLLRSKVVRLAAVLWQSGAGEAELASQQEGRPVVAQDQVPAEQRPVRLAEDELGRGIEIDMARIVATARALDTPILFVNYPLPFRSVPIIRRVGEQLGVPVLETHEQLARAMAEGHRPEELMMMAAGPHPRGLLYGYVADAMVPWVVTALRDHHGIDLREPAGG